MFSAVDASAVAERAEQVVLVVSKRTKFRGDLRFSLDEEFKLNSYLLILDLYASCKVYLSFGFREGVELVIENKVFCAKDDGEQHHDVKAPHLQGLVPPKIHITK